MIRQKPVIPLVTFLYSFIFTSRNPDTQLEQRASKLFQRTDTTSKTPTIK